MSHCYLPTAQSGLASIIPWLWCSIGAGHQSATTTVRPKWHFTCPCNQPFRGRRLDLAADQAQANSHSANYQSVYQTPPTHGIDPESRPQKRQLHHPADHINYRNECIEKIERGKKRTQINSHRQMSQIGHCYRPFLAYQGSVDRHRRRHLESRASE